MNHTKFLLAITLLILACKDDTQTDKKNSSPRYPVLAVEQRNVNTFYSFPANISGINNNQVRPKISGYIKEVLVDEGQKVQKGQLLFRLETNIQDQNADAAKMQINSAQATVETATANVKVAQVEVDKLIPLVEKNIISSIQLEIARANLLRAKGQLSQAKASKETAKANYQSIKENIKFSNITSPINGIIGKLNYREGALVSPQDPTPITTVSDISEIFAYFSINEKQFIYFFQNFPGADLEKKINLVPPIELELANGTIFEEKGKLETSTGQIDPNTGTIQFRVKFENSGGLLSNGNTGKIRIPRTYNNALVIPESATFEQQGIVYSYKVDKDSVVSTVITLRDRVNKMAIIEKGLKKGDTIVAKGVSSLNNGDKINPQQVTIDSIITIHTVK